MVALTAFTNRTKIGKAMRACSEDKVAAQLMGINVDTTISITFATGSCLRRSLYVLLCAAYPTSMPTNLPMPGIKAFTQLGFRRDNRFHSRAFLGGVLLGIIEIFAKAYISTQTAS